MTEQAKITKVVPISGTADFRVHFSLDDVSGDVQVGSRAELPGKVAEEVERLRAIAAVRDELNGLVDGTVELPEKKSKGKGGA